MDVYIYDWVYKSVDNHTYYIGFGIDKDDNRVSIIEHTFHRPLYVNKWLLEHRICDYITLFTNIYETLSLESSIEYKLVDLRKMREGYDDPKTYLCIATQSLTDYDTIVRFMEYNKVKVYEADIDPMTVFLNKCDINRTGWVHISNYTIGGGDVATGVTTGGEYYVCNVYIKSIDRHDIPDMGVLCMDIETYSTSKYKVPMSFDPADEVRMIGTAYRYKGCTTKKAFCIGDLGHNIIDCDDYTIVMCHNQRDLIEAYIAYVSTLRVEVIIGFNHLSYDYAFLVDRYFRGMLPRVSYSKLMGHPIQPTKETWSSSAYKNNDFWLLCAPGILDIDIMQFAIREGQYKGHSLNEIATVELGEQKLGLSYDTMHDMFHRNTRNDIVSIAEYCLQDCILPLDIFDKKQVLVYVLERSKVQRTSPNSIFTKGSGHQALGHLHQQCSLHGYLMTHDTIPKIRYKGAAVVNPIPGIYEHCATVDFSSLYPSIIIDDNICYTTYVPMHIRQSMLDTYNDVEVELDRDMAVKYFNDAITSTSDTTATVLCSFISSRKGVIPDLVSSLIKQRKYCKSMLSKCPPNEVAIWNMRQYAYKIAANSIYGLLGSNNSYMSFLIGATCVTAKGRYHLNKTITSLETLGATVVYGDTDSCFIKVPGCDTAQAYKDTCSTICKELSGDNIRLEYENAFSKLLIISKKRYIGIRYDGSEYIKGIASVRRNRSATMKRMYNELFRVILESEIKEEPVVYVQMMLHAIANGRIKPDELKIAVTINDYMINKEHEALIHHMEEVGIPRLPNEKVYYVYTMCGVGGSHTSYRRHYDWVIKNNVALDYMLYIQYEVMPEIDKLLELVGLDPIVRRYVYSHTTI